MGQKKIRITQQLAKINNPEQGTYSEVTERLKAEHNFIIERRKANYAFIVNIIRAVTPIVLCLIIFYLNFNYKLYAIPLLVQLLNALKHVKGA
jgi:hypothetical protein